MKKIVTILLIVFLLIAFLVTCSLSFMGKEMEEAKKELESIEAPDLSLVEDGRYYGKENTPLVKVEVEVTVENKTISSISILRHENGKGKPGEAVIDDMIKSNTPDVELVSGATMSSLVIRSAVIDALENGIK